MAPRSVDTREQKVGQVGTFDMPASGPVGDVDFDGIETVDTPRWKDKAKALAFMDEIVHVKIADTGAINEEQFVDVGNGGIRQFIARGQWQPVKRKFVEVLARAKKENIATPQYVDATGANAIRIIKTPAQKYPFEMRDKNPDGYVWLQRIITEV